MISIYISPFHVNGDQVHYIKVYNMLGGTDLQTGRQLYIQHIFSFEYIHFLITWIFANLGFDKIIAMSFMNAVLTAFFANFLMTKTSNYTLIFVLVITNVYLYTMFFTLEKLKFGFIFLLAGILYKRKSLLLISCMSHVQVLFLNLSYLISHYLHGLKISNRLSIKKSTVITLFIGMLVFLFIFYALFRYIMLKYAFYNSNFGSLQFESILACVSIGAFTFFLSDQQKLCLFYFTFLCFMITLVGAERLNMFAVFGCFFFIRFRSMHERNGLVFNLGLLLLSTYLAYKSYHYLRIVVLYGG